ncbi:ribosome production factor 2 homolog [Selaginella moellendorffii]|uniref:ribosome production factor 2 homolog n=1 Tax=Selaginella moellendorffii TaxID=88036 RepID=UPI000D1CFF56|nr:ribosome production factor 2 homolog [Selaginella moellendorffii]|eukprot:XP_024543972.1 ribosome production factor 2 homolog [Selaginella moellendorffii]
MLRVVKPKTKQARRVLEKRAPKIKENVKKALLLHGTSTSAVVKGVLSDLHHIKKDGGNAVHWTRKNENIRPFEPAGAAPLEFFSKKTDCSLVVFGSHSKKRPNNIVFGRFYDNHVYDFMELGVERYKSVKDHGGARKFSPQVGSKPCFAFIGEAFESDEKCRQFKEMMLDFFRGEEVDRINLAGLDRVFVCVATATKVLFRHCAIRLMKSGTKVPQIVLVDVGPSLDMVFRRNQTPGEELRKEAMRTVSKAPQKKIKNVSSDMMDGKVGRIYMPKQEVGEIALKKMKGLKRERREAAAALPDGERKDEARKKLRQNDEQ